MKPGANLLFRLWAVFRKYITNSPNTHWQKIPVIINNFNRLEFLQQQLEWLEKAGMRNIYIIDNASSYPPLLAYYKKCPYTIFRINANVGHLALWKTHIYKWFENTYYVYTDPDIIPTKQCPLNAVEHFGNLLKKHPEIGKVGFGLKIDDLPNHYPLKQKVISWEKRFWENEIEPGVFKAKIDTTFALYRPNTKGDHTLPALRTGHNFVARHLPWYVNYNELSTEEAHHAKNATNASSWNQELNNEGSRY